LRLPEARAKEIARDISAKILVRVRDALRGLHVEQPKSGLPAATAQVGLPAATNVAQASLPAVTPARNERTSGAAQAGLPAATNVVQAGVRNPQLTPRVAPSPANRMSPLSPRTAPPATGNTGSVPKVTTPFSPQAKWNLGGASGSPPAPELRRAGKFQVESPTKNAPREESILARQAAEKEESLSREAVLHGIENPDTLKVGSYKLESPREAKPETPVGPTGWRPAGGPSAPAGKEVGSRKYEGSGAIPKPTVEKARPQSESAPPPPKPAQEPQNFLDEKLAGPARLQREERNFTTDPYREPLE